MDHVNQLIKSILEMDSDECSSGEAKFERFVLLDQPFFDSQITLRILTQSKTYCRYVKLNVGGWLYQTTVTTLTSGDHMLASMFSGRLDVVKGNSFTFIL